MHHGKLCSPETDKCRFSIAPSLCSRDPRDSDIDAKRKPTKSESFLKLKLKYKMMAKFAMANVHQKLELARSGIVCPVGSAGSIFTGSVPPFGGLTALRLRKNYPHHTWQADRGQEFGSN